jgi:tetratricopeptide (TPR) repeat protein
MTRHDAAPQFSRKRFGWAALLFKARMADLRGDFEGAITFLDKATQLNPARDEDRAYRALLLLRCQRLDDAQSSLAALRKEFERSSDPDRQYLWRWTTATLGLMHVNASQFDREAKAAQSIPCRRRIRLRFPLPLPSDD